MNQSNELRRGRRRRQPAPDAPRRPHGLERGPRQHLRHHARQRHRGRTWSRHFNSRSIPACSPRPPAMAALSSASTSLRPCPRPSGTSTTSTLKPEIVSVTDAAGHVFRVQHSKYNPKVAKANKIGQMHDFGRPRSPSRCPPPVKPANEYTVQVKGLGATSGTYLSDSTFPAMSPGTGTVAKTNIQDDQDGSRRDGHQREIRLRRRRQPRRRHQQHGLEDRQENLGVTTKVSPVVSVNLDPASDPAANRTTTFSTVHFAGTTTPDATVTFLDQSAAAPSTAPRPTRRAIIASWSHS